MNKRASKIILFTTVGLMIATAVSIGISNKEEYGLVDISGNRKNLENVNFIYQKRIGSYKTTEVKLSKDKTEVDKFAKDSVPGLPINDYYKGQRNFYGNGYNDLSQNYEDENVKGLINAQHEYDSSSKLHFSYEIKEKNLKTNKIEEYKIPINNDEISENGPTNWGYPIKYNGDLYTIVIFQGEQIGILNKEVDDIYAGKEAVINIYKLDLEGGEAKLVDSQKLSFEDGYVSAGSTMFKHGNKYYISKDTYEKVSDKELKTAKEIKTTKEMIIYDLATNKFETVKVDEGITAEYNYSTLNVEKNLARIIYYAQENKGIKMSILTLDLNTDKFTKEKEDYTIEMPDKEFDYGINKIRCIDNKLYISVDAYEKPDVARGRQTQNKSYIYVIDEKTKNVLYSGLIKDEKNSFLDIDIISDDEL